MKIGLKLISVLFLSVLIVAPLFVSADGLVPCGGEGEKACDFCYFVILVDNVQEFLLIVLILPAGVIALIIAGIMLLTAGGNTAQIEKGKSIFKYAIIGILIAFAAWLIVDTILGNLLQDKYLPWNKFPSGQCQLFN